MILPWSDVAKAREWNLVTLLYAIVRYLSFFLILYVRKAYEGLG